MISPGLALSSQPIQPLIEGPVLLAVIKETVPYRLSLLIVQNCLAGLTRVTIVEREHLDGEDKTDDWPQHQDARPFRALRQDIQNVLRNREKESAVTLTPKTAPRGPNSGSIARARA